MEFWLSKKDYIHSVCLAEPAAGQAAGLRVFVSQTENRPYLTSQGLPALAQPAQDARKVFQPPHSE